MNIFRFTLAFSTLLVTAFGETIPTKETKKASGWNVELVPKAFQKNPNLDITVISEVSAAGKKRAAVSSENPVYYVTHSGGYQVRGTPMPQKFPAAEVEKILQRALASSGYFPATAEHSPSIVVTYTWGAHNVESDDASTNQVIRNVLDGAALVGGDRFATELAHALAEANAIGNASAPPIGGGSEGTADFGAAVSSAQAAGIADPVRRFKERSKKNDFLFEQATTNCYYIVASAFDYESIASSKRLLLWRTRMTVNASGVSQLEAIPMMVTAAAPYLGQDMPESEIITKRAVPKGQVEVGAPTLVDPAPVKPAATK